MLYDPLVHRAFALAALAHDGQRRKLPREGAPPYIIHPAQVALLLARAGFAPPVLAAAVLHDTVEDTDVSLDTIRAELGDEVAALVDWVTEQDKSLPWEARKAAYLARLHHAPPNALAVSAADKIHNLRSVVGAVAHATARGDDPAHIWGAFKRPASATLHQTRLVYDLFTARAQTHPELGPLCDDLREAMRAFAAAAGLGAQDVP